MYQYQKSSRYFAQVAHGIEELGAEELIELGARDTKTDYRGVHFNADQESLYRIVYQTRIATRILAPLLTFDCHSTRYLYKTARAMEWSDFMTERQTFAVFSSVSHSIIRHSKYAALILKDAIVDYFRDNKGSRPSIDTINPDVWFNLHIQNDRAVISLAASGSSLHRRGYRIEAGEAPMQETVAATIIRMSGWDGATPLYDPMCGSGTLLCEAMMHYRRLPAGVLRDQFGFRHLPDFKRDVWRTVRESARDQLRPLPGGLIRGSDISPTAIRQAGKNAGQLEQGDQIEFTQSDYRKLQGLENSTIVCNPPYGLRLRQGGDITEFYAELGDFLKNKCQGATAYIYFGKRELLKNIGLRASWKRPLVSGSLDGRLAKFEMF